MAAASSAAERRVSSSAPEPSAVPVTPSLLLAEDARHAELARPRPRARRRAPRRGAATGATSSARSTLVSGTACVVGGMSSAAVHLADPRDRAEDDVELTGEQLQLLLGHGQPGQPGQVCDLVAGDVARRWWRSRTRCESTDAARPRRHSAGDRGLPGPTPVIAATYRVRHPVPACPTCCVSCCPTAPGRSAPSPPRSAPSAPTSSASTSSSAPRPGDRRPGRRPAAGQARRLAGQRRRDRAGRPGRVDPALRRPDRPAPRAGTARRARRAARASRCRCSPTA